MLCAALVMLQVLGVSTINVKPLLTLSCFFSQLGPRSPPCSCFQGSYLTPPSLFPSSGNPFPPACICALFPGCLIPLLGRTSSGESPLPLNGTVFHGCC